MSDSVDQRLITGIVFPFCGPHVLAPDSRTLATIRRLLLIIVPTATAAVVCWITINRTDFSLCEFYDLEAYDNEYVIVPLLWNYAVIVTLGEDVYRVVNVEVFQIITWAILSSKPHLTEEVLEYVKLSAFVEQVSLPKIIPWILAWRTRSTKHNCILGCQFIFTFCNILGYIFLSVTVQYSTTSGNVLCTKHTAYFAVGVALLIFSILPSVVAFGFAIVAKIPPPTIQAAAISLRNIFALAEEPVLHHPIGCLVSDAAYIRAFRKCKCRWIPSTSGHNHVIFVLYQPGTECACRGCHIDVFQPYRYISLNRHRSARTARGPLFILLVALIVFFIFLIPINEGSMLINCVSGGTGLVIFNIFLVSECVQSIVQDVTHRRFVYKWLTHELPAGFVAASYFAWNGLPHQLSNVLFYKGQSNFGIKTALLPVFFVVLLSLVVQDIAQNEAHANQHDRMHDVVLAFGFLAALTVVGGLVLFSLLLMRYPRPDIFLDQHESLRTMRWIVKGLDVEANQAPSTKLGVKKYKRDENDLAHLLAGTDLDPVPTTNATYD